MKTKILTICLTLITLAATASAQTTWADAFSKFKLEARADFEVMADGGNQTVDYGTHGRYFNLMLGGDLGNKFSYYFRQRLKAEAGSVHFFDNTDFLWLNYQASDNWRFRFGKDAMAVGGFEYDAPPIDEYMVSEYWNNFYCFQLGVSAAYTTNDGRQTVVAQVTQSPYINSRRDQGETLGWNAGLLAYNLQWIGKIGDHINTLWSTSMIERKRHNTDGTYMNLTMLGTQLYYERWSLYLDLMHHALDWEDWGDNYGWVLRFDYRLTPSWTLFAKNSREVNHSKAERRDSVWVDQMVPAGHSYTKTGLGFEYRPKGMAGVRLHGYAALMSDLGPSHDTPDYSLCLNMGATWTVDFRKMFKK